MEDKKKLSKILEAYQDLSRKSFNSHHRTRLFILTMLIAFLYFIYHQYFDIQPSLLQIVSLSNLGYHEEVVTKEAYVDGVHNVHYNLNLSLQKEQEEPYSFSLSILDSPSNDRAYQEMLNQMVAIKKHEKNYLSTCKKEQGCIDITSNYDKTNVVVQFTELDANLWQSDKAFSLFPLHHLEEKQYMVQVIYLLKQSRLVTIEVSKDFFLDEDTIKELSKATTCDLSMIKE